MRIKNKIEKPFGTSGSMTGIVMFIAGGIMLYFSLIGIVIAIPGAFIGFTYIASLIDFDRKRIKFITYLFGIIPYGKWIDLKPEMKLGLKKTRRGYQTSTRGHIGVFHDVDYRIILKGIDNRQIFPIYKSESIDLAKSELNKLSNQLNLEIT